MYRRNHWKMAGLLLLALMLPAAVTTARSGSSEASLGRVSPVLLERLAAGETEEVVVSFALPDDWRKRSLADRRAIIRDRVAGLEARLVANGGVLLRSYVTINALIARIDAGTLQALISDPIVSHVDEIKTGRLTLLESVPQIGLDGLRDSGADGDGVRVAVVDSGIDSDHADLSDDLIAERCFCSLGGGCCPGGSTTASGAGSAEDDNGHGTHVSGIITSRGTQSPLGGSPDAEIVAIKVAASSGGLNLMDVADALEWIDLNNGTLEVDLVNLSLGGGAFSGHCDGDDATNEAFSTAVENLREAGVLVFAASGNNGFGSNMLSPACIEGVVSTGAVYDYDGIFPSDDPNGEIAEFDEVTAFSNLSATTDLMSPGAEITSTLAGGGSTTSYGTSQATPLAVACAAALEDALSLEDPSPADLERALEVSSTCVTRSQTNGGPWEFPRIDCAAALDYLSLDDAAANDNFDGRVELVGATGLESGSNDDATLECDEFVHLGGNGVKSVWWRWTAPASGTVEFNTFGSDFDTVLGIFLGDSVRSLSQIAENDDASPTFQSQVVFSAVGGNEYAIAVTGYGGANGQVQLSWSAGGEELIFSDGFESGDMTAWSVVSP